MGFTYSYHTQHGIFLSTPSLFHSVLHGTLIILPCPSWCSLLPLTHFTTLEKEKEKESCTPLVDCAALFFTLNFFIWAV